MQVGTDIEPLSIKAALANAAHNGVASRLEAYPCAANLDAGEPLADAGVPTEERQFDVLVANILQVCVPVNQLPVQHFAPHLDCLGFPGRRGAGWLSWWPTSSRCVASEGVLEPLDAMLLPVHMSSLPRPMVDTPVTRPPGARPLSACRARCCRWRRGSQHTPSRGRCWACLGYCKSRRPR